MPRASVALPDGFTGTRPARQPVALRVMPGQVPLPYLEPHYFPSKGAHFGKQLILKHPKAILAAHRKVGAWLAAADPRTDPGFSFMAAFWEALNDVVSAHGVPALFFRYNHI